MSCVNPLQSEPYTKQVEIKQTEPNDASIDPFLLSSLDNEKDRLTMLKIDKEIEHFFNDKTKNRLQFPHMTSYHRRIVHRVADYFKLLHYSENDTNGQPIVVLYKTELSRIPILRFSDLYEESEEKLQKKDANLSFAKPVRIMKRDNSVQKEDVLTQNELNGNLNTEKTVLSKEEEYEKVRKLIFGQETETKTEEETEENVVDNLAWAFSNTIEPEIYDRNSINVIGNDFSHNSPIHYPPQTYPQSFHNPPLNQTHSQMTPDQHILLLQEQKIQLLQLQQQQLLIQNQLQCMQKCEAHLNIPQCNYNYNKNNENIPQCNYNSIIKNISSLSIETNLKKENRKKLNPKSLNEFVELSKENISSENGDLLFDYTSEKPFAHFEYIQPTEPKSEAPSHILEIYNIPNDISKTKSDKIFSNLEKIGGRIKWLTKSFAVAVFKSSSLASKALQILSNEKYKLKKWDGKLK